MSAAPPAAPAAPTIPTAPANPAVTLPAIPAVKRDDQITDLQTGKVFKKLPEQWYDIASAWISAFYSLAVIGYLTFMVLNMLSGNFNFWPDALTDNLGILLTTQVSKLLLYTAIGGAMGAAVNNLRSFIAWHAEERAFGWRFIWKYVAMPPLGGTLAVLVYGILQGGMAVINGGATPENNQLTALSAWATGTLAGYGSHKVFIWLDDKVNTLFKIDKKQAAVPDVIGKSQDEAKQMLSSAQLSVGAVSEQAVSADQVGRVITQTPLAGTQIDCGSKVDLTVGVARAADGANPIIAPELTGTASNGNGNKTPTNAAGALVNETAATGTTGTTDTTSGKTNTTEASAAATGTGETTGSTDATATDSTATDTAATDATATDAAAADTTDSTATGSTAADTTEKPPGDETATAAVGSTASGSTDTEASG